MLHRDNACRRVADIAIDGDDTDGDRACCTARCCMSLQRSSFTIAYISSAMVLECVWLGDIDFVSASCSLEATSWTIPRLTNANKRVRVAGGSCPIRFAGRHSLRSIAALQREMGFQMRQNSRCVFAKHLFRQCQGLGTPLGNHPHTSEAFSREQHSQLDDHVRVMFPVHQCRSSSY
jgi:hypothetical protein